MTIDLTTNYLGMELINPLVVSACPLTGHLGSLRQLELAGASAAVLPSLFEETVRHEESQISKLYEYQADTSAESLSYFPEMRRYNIGPDQYLLHLREAKKAVAIPIIGSIDGTTSGGWTRYAKLIEEAGADALELNIYFVPTDPNVSADAIEERYLDLISSVRETISIPMAVKMGPCFTNIASTAQKFVAAGADGLVLFNRYLDPDLDIEALKVDPTLVLSNRHELRLSLRWLAIIRDQTKASLAATSGIHLPEDVIKSLMAGADVAMMASVLLEHGPEYLATMLRKVERWLVDNEYESVEQLKGSMSRENCPDPDAFERANYTRALVSFADVFRTSLGP